MTRENFLIEALKEAQKAYVEGEVPIGSVIVKEGRIVARAYNAVEKLKDPSAHAEILALRRASLQLGSKYLTDCTLYVTIEPCIMCAYALILFKVKEVVFGALDEKHGGILSLYNLLNDERTNHNVKWIYLPFPECGKLLKDFFKERR